MGGNIGPGKGKGGIGTRGGAIWTRLGWGTNGGAGISPGLKPWAAGFNCCVCFFGIVNCHPYPCPGGPLIPWARGDFTGETL